MNVRRTTAPKSIAVGSDRSQADGGNTAYLELLCPSAQYSFVGARVFAVVAGTVDMPQVAYLNAAVPVSDEILELAGPVGATEVFRFAAPCQSQCGHNHNGTCHLVDKVARLVPEASEKLPKCAIRNECKWWHQEGPGACRRCSVMATSEPNQTKHMRTASDPNSVE